MIIWPCFICGVDTICKHRELEIVQHIYGCSRESMQQAKGSAVVHIPEKRVHFVKNSVERLTASR